MADKNWQAGRKDVILARVVLCLVAIVAPCGFAWGLSGDFTPMSYLGAADPNMVWEALIGSIVVCSFLTAILLWFSSALRTVKRSLSRKNAFVSSALNNLN